MSVSIVKLGFNECARVLNSVVTCKTLQRCDEASIGGHFSQADFHYLESLEKISIFRISGFISACNELCRSRVYSAKVTRLSLCGY